MKLSKLKRLARLLEELEQQLDKESMMSPRWEIILRAQKVVDHEIRDAERKRK